MSLPNAVSNGRSYTVMRCDGCTLVTGAIPVDHLTALASTQPGAVLSSHLARLAGVNIAWGEKDAVDALEDKLMAEAIRPGMSPMDRWLAGGERGQSSEAILARLRGVRVNNPTAHPRDAGDFARCLRLLLLVPGLTEDVHLMADVSPVWAALAAAWPQLTEDFLREVPVDWQTASVWHAPEFNKKLLAVIADRSRGQ